MLLKLDNINVELGRKKIFDNLNFIFNEKDKIGIVGNNGEGKTTLLNVILKKVDFNGDVLLENTNFGYISQDEHFKDLSLIDKRKEELEAQLCDEKTINDSNKYSQILEEYNNLVATDEIQREERLIKIFKFRKHLFYKEQKSNLSGGESTKLKLIKLFVKRYEYYLFDEPTNHLDIYTKNKLIVYLSNVVESFIVVSHDIELLNKCCNKILYINDRKVKLYHGNYDSFIEQKNKEEEELEKQKEKQESKKRRLREQIENIKAKTGHELGKRGGPTLRNLGTGKGSAEAAIAKAQKLIKKKTNEMENMESIELPKDERIQIKKFSILKSYNHVLNVKDLKKHFDDFDLFVKNFDIFKCEKVALIGENGSGKTTLLNVILEKLEKDSGKYSLGQNVKIGFLSQKNENLDEEKTIMQELEFLNLTETKIRTSLGNFLFKTDDVFKRIKNLSGGEKIRLSLLKLILQGCNFLILDEPSNHLDIKSKEILANALNDYEGTILVVSHDMQFLEKFVTRFQNMENGLLE